LLLMLEPFVFEGRAKYKSASSNAQGRATSASSCARGEKLQHNFPSSGERPGFP
jgi:hypothetical protein